MQETKGVEKILDKWRGLIKSKRRAIITFEEILQARIESLRPWIFADTLPLDGWTVRQFRYTRHAQREYLDEQWRPIQVGNAWGGPNTSAYFRCQAELPKQFDGRCVALKLYFGGDGLLRVDGAPYHGLDPFRDTVFISDTAEGGRKYDLEVEAYIMWHFGEGTTKTFEASHWAVFDHEINDAYWDLRTVFNVMMTDSLELDVVDFLRKAVDEATRHIDQRCQDYDEVRQAALLSQRIIRELVYDSDRFQRDGLVHLVGNSHLDLVYLWTHAEFVRKVGRTHATALRLMERYPDYVFTQSQPHMYAQMQKCYPNLFEQVQARVAENRWEPVGAFWVEPDCNLISGESMVRQLLHGIRYYQQQFGVTPRTAWIPDVFGNAWTMPQILVKAGLKYFVTHKMSVWNDTNPWQHNAFWWESPDGSRIFSHVPTTHFIGTAEPDHIKEHWDRFSARSEIGESLYCYGWGDGGGGPDIEMLEYCKRYDALPGLVPCINTTVENALERMRLKAEKADIPVINDELYLEEHRGVFTTKGRLKKLNRYCELLYRKAEMFACFARGEYPREALSQGWRELLTNQFHDSLPGTHVTEAYHDILESYDSAVAIGEEVLSTALGEIASRVDTSGLGAAAIVFNSQPFIRSTRARIPCASPRAHVVDDQGREVPSQFCTDAETGDRALVFEAEVLPPVGYRVYRVLDGPGADIPPKAVVTQTGDKFTLENPHLKVVINGEGQVVSLVEKATGCEMIDPQRRGNVFHLYEDIPGTFDAWDIEEHYTSREFPLGNAAVESFEQGLVQASLLVTRRFRSSRISQQIVLGGNARRLDFQTHVDWHEQHKLLKVRFHTTLRSRKATFDIAYGNIERPTTRNNPFETAKFEVPAHQWMDLSQADRGLSLLTDCKYGYEARGQMIALSLLKGPKYPDPVSDQEEHWFTYSLFPHGRGWREAKVIAEGADLNDPVDVRLEPSHEGPLPPTYSFLGVDGEGVTLEAVKRAEASDDLIVRLVERHGADTSAVVTTDDAFESAADCNLLEESFVTLPASDATVRLDMRPYEIRTIRLQRNA